MYNIDCDNSWDKELIDTLWNVNLGSFPCDWLLSVN